MVLAGASIHRPPYLTAELANRRLPSRRTFIAALQATSPSTEQLFLLAGTLPMRDPGRQNPQPRPASSPPPAGLAFQDKQTMTRFRGRTSGASPAGAAPENLRNRLSAISASPSATTANSPSMSAPRPTAGAQPHPHPQLHRHPRRLQPRPPLPPAPARVENQFFVCMSPPWWAPLPGAAAIDENTRLRRPCTRHRTNSSPPPAFYRQRRAQSRSTLA